MANLQTCVLQKGLFTNDAGKDTQQLICPAQVYIMQLSMENLPDFRFIFHDLLSRLDCECVMHEQPLILGNT